MNTTTSLHVVRPNEGALGALRVLAGDAATAGRYFAFEMETPPSESEAALDVHAHAAYDESEYVLSGSRQIVIEDQRWTCASGFFALAPRQARHGMRTVGTAPSRWLHFFSPAGIEAYFRERERLRDQGASPEELRALSVRSGASHDGACASAEPAYSAPGEPSHGRVVVSGRDTRDAYALVELITLPEAPHTHADQEEAFYVISGELTVDADQTSTALPTGSFVLIPRGVPHRHHVTRGSRLLAVYSPGHVVQHVES